MMLIHIVEKANIQLAKKVVMRRLFDGSLEGTEPAKGVEPRTLRRKVVAKGLAKGFEAFQPIGETVSTQRLMSKRRTKRHVLSIMTKNNEAQIRILSVSKGLKDL